MNEIIFAAEEASDGGYIAKALERLGHRISRQTGRLSRSNCVK
ncbi:MAG: hypothetical protein WCI11_02945 [Candidatus Methylumidiphilus sp.]